MRREIGVMGVGEIKKVYLRRLVHLFKEGLLWGKSFNLPSWLYEENHIFRDLSFSECSFNTSYRGENMFIQYLFKILHNFIILLLIQWPIGL